MQHQGPPVEPQWKEVCPIAEIPNHTLLTFRFDQDLDQWITPDPLVFESEDESFLPAIILWKSGGEYAIYDQHCPHLGTKLSPIPYGTKLVCGMHRWTFELEDGTCLNNTENLTTYPTKIEDGILWVTLGKT